MKTTLETETPFQKLKQLTERLIALPKKEGDEKQKQYEQQKRKSESGESVRSFV